MGEVSTDENAKFLLVILVGSLSALLLVSGIIITIIRHQKKMAMNQQAMQAAREDFQKKLLASSVQSQERERERIARDLHDEIGASLSAVKLSLNLNHRQKDLDDTAIKSINEMIDHSIQNVKSISRNLLPINLKKFGLNSAIKTLCDEINTVNKIISFSEKGDQKRLESDIELGIFRIAQELISNAVQHSGASSIQVSMCWNEESLALDVLDNGVGISSDVRENSNGLGMDNIYSRAQTIEGKFNFGSNGNESGTKATLILPINQNSEGK